MVSDQHWTKRFLAESTLAEATETKSYAQDALRLLHEIKEEITAMSDRENLAYDRLNQTILTVKDGWASLVAERDAFKTALEQADANQAQAVQAALDADSDVDAAKVEAADAALAELVAEPPPAA